jgi:hypothetical protein
MNEDNLLYLERGSPIYPGSLLKVWDEKDKLNGLYEVVDVKKHVSSGVVHGSVEVKPVSVECGAIVRGIHNDFSLSDLEDLAFRHLLVIYNPS